MIAAFLFTMEYSEIETQIANLSINRNGTGFIDDLPECEKWDIYDMFKQQVQHIPPDEYEQVIYLASEILNL